MADVPSTHLSDGANTPKVAASQGGSFDKDAHMYSMIKTQRKRLVTRPLYSTLSMMDDASSRHKKRNRKADKRYVVEKLDGFTFVSAFTLNDFDEYDESFAMTKSSTPPPSKLKRKSTAKIECAASKKAKSEVHTIPENLVTTVDNVHAFPEKSYTSLLNKEEGYTTSNTPKAKIVPSALGPTTKTKNRLRNHVCSIPGNIGASGGIEKGGSNLILNDNLSNKSLPLTKTALVRLKKINVSCLNESKNIPKNIHSSNEQSGQIQVAKHGQKHSSAQKARKHSKAPHMHKPKHGKAATFNKSPTGANRIIITDSEDNVELDVCSIDDSSSSTNFILKNLRPPEEYGETSGDSKPKNDEKHKRKRKLCPTCALNPCHIVGAKRIKSNEYRLPRFDVSYTTTCRLHPPGEISVIAKSSSDSTDVNIQTTPMDIKMHVDFAKRFPYQAISIASCQPSLENEMNARSIRRCSENHRFLEQQRREELHGLYCKLAEAIAIPKHRASKIWILENALKEIKTLQDNEKQHLTAFEREKDKNEKLRRRWEELSEKPYIPPREDNGVLERKSKLMELYDKYRQESKEKLQMNLTTSKNKLEQQKVRKEESNSRPTVLSNNSVLKPSRNVSRRKLSIPCKRLSSLGSRQSMSVNHDKVIKRATEIEIVAPHSVIHPFKPICSESTSISGIPTLKLTPQIMPKLINQPQKSVNPVTTAGCIITQAACSTYSRSSLTKSRAQHTVTDCYTMAAPDQTKQSIATSQTNGTKTSPVVAASNEFVIVSMVVKGRTMVFRIPKTAEGLTMLNRLSLMKKLNAESVAKIVSQFSALTQPGPSAVSKCATVPASRAAITVTPTQWSNAATSSETVAPQSLKQPIPFSTIMSSPQTVQILDASQNVNARRSNDTMNPQNVIFLDMKDKPNRKAFSVIPTSSSINVTLNKTGSITVNKLFNKKQTNPISQVNFTPTSLQPTFPRHSPSTNVSNITFFSSSSAASANVHQIQTSTAFSGLSSTTISTTTVPRIAPTINIPNKTLLCVSPVTTAHISSANVHPYPLPLQTPLGIPVNPISAIPQLSDLLMEDPSQHQDTMEDNGMCVISNVFSLTDTAGTSHTEHPRTNDPPRL